MSKIIELLVSQLAILELSSSAHKIISENPHPVLFSTMLQIFGASLPPMYILYYCVSVAELTVGVFGRRVGFF